MSLITAHSGPGAKEGDLTLRIESGDKRVRSESWGGLMYVAAGSDPFLLIERGERPLDQRDRRAAALPSPTLAGPTVGPDLTGTHSIMN